MRTNDTVALVTGSTSGLGRAVATSLARKGARVLVHGRDPGRTRALAAELCARGGHAEPYIADLADLAQVTALARRVTSQQPKLDVLINNAGVGAGRPPYRKRELSRDGHELRFAVNYLAPALLTRLLVPLLTASAPARVVNVGSVGQAPVDFSDLQLERHYSGSQAYFRSKFALAALTFDLADELRGSGVTVNCVHPATFMNTRQVRQAGVIPWHSPRAGVPPVLNLAVGSDGDLTGRYYEGKRLSRAHGEAYQDSTRQRLRGATDAMLEPFSTDLSDGHTKQ